MFIRWRTNAKHLLQIEELRFAVRRLQSTTITSVLLSTFYGYRTRIS